MAEKNEKSSLEFLKDWGGGLTNWTEKRDATPWERRLQLGLWKGIKQTIKSVLFSPKNMFSSMPVKGGWREPLAFGHFIHLAPGGIFSSGILFE